MKVVLTKTLDTLLTLTRIACCVLALLLVAMLIVGLLTGKIALAFN